jgi:hypothetical protein
MSEWQTIDTAPRDGTKILIWDELNDEVSIVFFNHDDADAYTGWFHVNDWVGGARFLHWMPTPPKPSSEPTP